MEGGGLEVKDVFYITTFYILSLGGVLYWPTISVDNTEVPSFTMDRRNSNLETFKEQFGDV